MAIVAQSTPESESDTTISSKISAGELKIDLGCGPNKQKGFVGCDQIRFDGVDHIFDIGRDRWPFDDESVTEAFSSHFLEHLTARQRVHFVNELHRVLVPGGKATVIVPHWAAARAYGDPTHQWPPVSEHWFFYLDRDWRRQHAPHTDVQHWPPGFRCHFEATWGYSGHPALASRNVEMQQFASQWYKEANQDIHASLTKREG